VQKSQRLPSLPVILSWSVLVVVILGAAGVLLLQGSLRTSQDTRYQADVGAQAIVLDGCVLTGCNSEICADAENDRVSTCVVRPEQACYNQNGVCRRQAEGHCGWSQTAELTACLNSTKATPSATPSATPTATASASASPSPRPSLHPRPTPILRPFPSPSLRPLPFPSSSPLMGCSADTDCPGSYACLPVGSCPAGTQCLVVPKVCVPRLRPTPTLRPIRGTCTTDGSCGLGKECYQPPMPICPAGMACIQVMPPRYCRPKSTPNPTPSPSVSPSPTVRLGDINGDGKVDLIDYSLLKLEFLTAAPNSKADLNGDGKVDLVDYSIFIQELKK
jgi:hypothetical protein